MNPPSPPRIWLHKSLYGERRIPLYLPTSVLSPFRSGNLPGLPIIPGPTSSPWSQVLGFLDPPSAPSHTSHLLVIRVTASWAPTVCPALCKQLQHPCPGETPLESNMPGSFRPEQSQLPAGLLHSLAQLLKAPEGLLGAQPWQEAGVKGMRDSPMLHPVPVCLVCSLETAHACLEGEKSETGLCKL